ncbi:MAG: outer membrane protein assembly factor BamA [Bauldia sp.]|nr:outer membrane protein assembly factor BamA [Bauldia sp.]
MATNIQVQGNSRIDAATIRNYLTIRIGQDYTQADLNASLNALLATGLFSYAEVNGNGGTVVVVVVENPVVVQIVFDGNRRITDGDLRGVIQTQVRGVLSDAVLAADVRRIQERYASDGRAAAVVTTEVQRLDGNTANLIFHINEGGRVKIATIAFEGNEAYSDRQLASVIRTSESTLLSFLSRNDVYSRDRLMVDEELLRQEYLNNGYADFQVLSTDVRYDEVEEEYTITFYLSEGPLYSFGAITVDSTIPGISAEMLQRYVHPRSGRTFNATDVERTLQDISVALAEMGQPFAQVRPRGNRNYATNTIDIAFLVDQGPRTYIERIVVVGNERTRDYVIRREFDFAEGDAYNPVLVNRVAQRLRDLGIFQSVQIAAQQGSQPDQVILVVTIVEQRTGSLSATAGYSTTDGIIGEVSITERNFLGRGQYLRIAVSGNLSNRNYSVSFTEPYFLGRRIALSLNFFASSSGSTGMRPFAMTQTGGSVGFGLPLTGNLTAQVTYRFVTETRTDPDDAGPIVVPAYFGVGTSITSAVGYSFTYNTIDNPADPQGLFVRVAQEFAGVGGTERYMRSTFDARLYQDLWHGSPLTGMVRFRAGDIRGFGQPVRVLDNFFLSGETIRGFASYGPRTTDAAAIALGGQNYWAATAELQFPLPLVPSDWGFSGAIFADVGTLWGIDPAAMAGTPYDENIALRSSVGASVLWDSPFGVLRADFAKVLTQDPDDVTQVFRFSTVSTF